MTTMRRMLYGVAVGGLLLADGCAQLRRANATPPVPMEGELSQTLQQAEREVLGARFGVADRLLADYAEQHAGTPGSLEAGFWRSIFKLDPTNQTSGPRDAIALLDVYLAAPSVAHRGAATSLRRAAVALDRPPTVVVAPPAPGAPSAAPGRAEPRADTGNAEEVARLKEELAKANAELERIKRRLAQPNP
jgi:hypothetical protein